MPFFLFMNKCYSSAISKYFKLPLSLPSPEIYLIFTCLSVELKKQSSCCVHLVNKSDQYVAFKVSLQFYVMNYGSCFCSLKYFCHTGYCLTSCFVFFFCFRRNNLTPNVSCIHINFISSFDSFGIWTCNRLKQLLQKDIVFDQM